LNLDVFSLGAYITVLTMILPYVHTYITRAQSRTNLDAANEHAMTTLLSFLLTVPFVVYFEVRSLLYYVKFELSNAH
jgi:ABC-type transport system involved in Fe-S cluster assembly fused permease/ATPase subunit